jgi:hypothetical protein
MAAPNPFLDRMSYYPIEPHTRVLACYGCGLLIIDDQQAIDLHAIFHTMLDRIPDSE